MHSRVILNSKHLELTINRLCYQLIENHDDFSDSVLIGLQPRGVFLAERLKAALEKTLNTKVPTGNLDITFFRDDFRRREDPLIPQSTEMDFLVEDKKVILVDDVLFTGRTIRAGMDALMAYGRPKRVELLILIDRRFARQVPIRPDYIGKIVDSVAEEKVTVNWKATDGKDEVILFTPNEEK